MDSVNSKRNIHSNRSESSDTEENGRSKRSRLDQGLIKATKLRLVQHH